MRATLAAIGRLARHASRRALLIILAYRAEELAENPALHTLLRSLGRDMLLRPLLLHRFDDGEVAQFPAGLAQASPDQVAKLAPRLATSSGGNPLFLSVAVQSLLEAHGAPSLAALLPDLPIDAALPNLASAQHIRDLVLGRLERLPEPARELLDQLALIGRPVSLDLIEQLAGAMRPRSRPDTARAQLLVEEETGHLQIGHDLLRSIVARTIGSPRRAPAASAGRRRDRRAPRRPARARCRARVSFRSGWPGRR